MVRENQEGTLYSIFYGKPVAMAVDPIEKKPLYHFYPGSKSFSIATLGCNFQCPFCQNWDISQYGRDQTIDHRQKTIDQRQKTKDKRLERDEGSPTLATSNGQLATDEGRGKMDENIVVPEKVMQAALDEGCKTIAYTYSEPTIFFEYAYDIAKEAEKYDLKNIFVTNGFMTREMLDLFHPNLHAANIDLKAFKKETYKNFIKGDLNGVLDSIEYMKKLGIWIEVTTLIVPEMNDSKEELRDIAQFIASVGKDIPWHISRYHPAYHVTDKSPTSEKTLAYAYEEGKKAGLRYIYLGNIQANEKENTYCYNCNKLLIKRNGFYVEENKIKNGTCYNCNTQIDGVF